MIDIVINGSSANVRNIQDVGFKTSFRDRKFSELELNIDSLILVNESKELVHNWIATYGANVGIPTTINYENLNFDYYIDLTDNTTFRDREIEVKIKRRKGTDSFFEVSNALSFELLKARGVNFPLRAIPYVIVKDNQLEIGITLSIALYSISSAISNATQTLIGYVTDLASGTAGLSPALVASAVTKIAVQTIYLASLIITAINLAVQLKELVFPKVRFFNGCRIKDLIANGCENIGYTFQSTLLDSIVNLTHLPVPLLKNKDSIFLKSSSQINQSFTKGYPTASDTTPTLGSLIDSILDTFDAELKVNNGVVQLETKAYFKSLSTLSVTPFLNLKESRQNEYSLNTEDSWIRYYIHYQTDFNDVHTLDKFDPTDAEYGAKNNNQLEADLNLIKGLVDVNIPFALGVRKEELNFSEKIANSVFSSLDFILGTNLSSNIENRIGVLQISQQFFSVSKILLVDNNNRQVNNYLQVLKASSLWDNYHEENNTIATNGYRLFENAETLMNVVDFNNILANNYATIDGVECEILEIDFIPYQSKATISYKLKDDYANGKISTFVVNE